MAIAFLFENNDGPADGIRPEITDFWTDAINCHLPGLNSVVCSLILIAEARIRKNPFQDEHWMVARLNEKKAFLFKRNTQEAAEKIQRKK